MPSPASALRREATVGRETPARWAVSASDRRPSSASRAMRRLVEGVDRSRHGLPPRVGRGAGPAGPRSGGSSIVAIVTKGVVACPTQDRVRDSIAAIAAELGGTVGVAARNLASQAGVTVERRRPLPHGELLQGPHHGRGHAPGRRRRPAPRRAPHAHARPTRAPAAPSSTATRACGPRSAICST